MAQRSKLRKTIRYSKAFKMQVVRELEDSGFAFSHLQRKYGITGAATIQKWTLQLGNGSRGKVIRVETPTDINEMKRLKDRVRQLETLLADANVDLAVERACTRLACERAGIKDVAQFKKKSAGK